MAPVGEAYFPPLDRCFGGEYQLLSWQAAYLGLSQEKKEPDDGTTLQKFLTDPQTIEFLTNLFSPFDTPNAQTKSTFETRTSVINVAPSPQARYDIAEIKEDALWLSKKTSIDEVAALRITILEWQTRPQARLLQKDSQDYLTTGLQLSVQAGGVSTFRKQAWKKSELSEKKGLTDLRHLRLLEIFLSERCYLLKLSEYILSHYTCVASFGRNSSPDQSRTSSQNWLNEIGEAILSKWSIEDNIKSKTRTTGFISSAVNALETKRHNITEGCKWLEPQDIPESLQVAWGHYLSLEMIHILQITLSIVEVRQDILLTDSVVKWFTHMNQTYFYEGFVQSAEDEQGVYDLPLQSLCVLVSLAVIKISKALELLTEPSTSLMLAAENSDDSLPYVLNPPTIAKLHEIFVGLAPLRVASPIILAWSIIAQTIREIALTARESKETRQSLRAADYYNAPDSSDTDITERHSLRSVSSLRRRSSTGSDTSLQPLLVEDMNEATTLTAVDGDSISYLATHAIRFENVFDVVTTIASEFCTLYGFEHAGAPGQKMRKRLLDLISSCLDFIQYQPALIETTICVLTGKERFWDLLDRPVVSSYDHDQPSTLFIRSSALKQKLLLVAASRFPYESIPFLEFCRALAFQYTSSDGSDSTPWANLEELDPFTCKLPPGFEATEPIREEEEGVFIRLTDTLSVLIGSKETDLLSRTTTQLQQSRLPPPQSFGRHDLTISQVVIPAGTTGIVQSETKPFVVSWNYQYPGLAFMGKILQRASATGSSVEFPSIISPTVIAEVIQLISILLVSTMKNPRNQLRDTSTLADDSAQYILGQASDGLDRNDDIISVIFQIFDNELHNPQQGESGEPSLEILIQCTHFTSVLISVLPDRVWPFLGRSGLLKIDQEESQLSWVVSVEMVMGQYSFLLGCVRLYEALIEDTISHGVSRNTPTKSIARFGITEITGSGVSQPTMQSVLLSFTRSMIDVLESAMTWRFVYPADRMELNQRLCSAFDKILTYCYGTGETSGGSYSRTFTSPFVAAAKYIVNAFLSTSNNDFIVKPLMNVFTTAIHSNKTTLPILRDRYQSKQTIAALDLTSTLLHIHASLQPKSPSHLQDELFKATPILVRVYAAQESFRLPVVNLLNLLLSASAGGDRQPQSLLGHLGHDDANSFLEVLSHVDSPLQNDSLAIAIWKLFSTMVSKRQQWFALYILTGAVPRESLKNKREADKCSADGKEPILNIALNSLSCIEKLEPSRALGMLDFVATSADNWPWVFTTIHQHPEFLKAISEFTAQTEFVTNMNSVKPSTGSQGSDRLRIVSSITRILAMYTYFAQQNNDQKFARTLVPHLNYLIKNAISVPNFNNSLHTNLRTNLEAKFSGCSLHDFKKAQWRENMLGEYFYYDINLARKVLSYDAAWLGRKGQGFIEEFRRANVNLSLVEAQVNLFHGWKCLLTELSGPLAPDPQFQKIMASAVTDCLTTSMDGTMPQALLDRFLMSRADLAFTLLQRLVEEQSTDSDVQRILPIVWSTIRSYSIHLDTALGQKDPDYYRLLLRILYLALQFHTSSPSTSSSMLASPSENASSMAASSSLRSIKIPTIIIEILSSLIAQGFRSLTALVHSSPDRVLPSDFLILTSILRSCLRIPHIDQSSAQLLTAFSDSQTAYCAATLLSWSDQLASSTSGDPVFGELSMRFLVEFSSNTSLAESLAVDGVLGQVLSTNIIRMLQSQIFTPLEPLARMYTIWTRGVLPLLLNLLNAIGPPIAAEVAAALNSFPKQLSHSSNAFANNTRGQVPSDGYITLSMINEAHDLALITSILTTIREAGASAALLTGDVEEVKWDSAQLKEDIEGCLLDRFHLRGRIVATNQNEEMWFRTKPSKEGTGNETMLEEKAVGELKQLFWILSGDAEKEEMI